MPEITIVAEGEIEFEGITSPVSDVTIYLRIEDVSRADAPARSLGEKVVRGVAIPQNRHSRVPFSVQAVADDPNGRYVLRVHVDTGGNGEVKAGDYVTTQSYPLSTASPTRGMLVRVHRVG